MWPAAQDIRRWLTGVVLCVGAGALTFHLATWYGTDDPISLAVMVILAELFLGACIFLGVLITTRMSETLLLDPVHERRPSPAPAVWSAEPIAEPSPADRRLQRYLRRVLHECDRSDSAPHGADRRRTLTNAPVAGRRSA